MIVNYFIVQQGAKFIPSHLQSSKGENESLANLYLLSIHTELVLQILPHHHLNSLRLKVASISVRPRPLLCASEPRTPNPVTVRRVNKVYCVSNCHLAYS